MSAKAASSVRTPVQMQVLQRMHQRATRQRGQATKAMKNTSAACGTTMGDNYGYGTLNNDYELQTDDGRDFAWAGAHEATHKSGATAWDRRHNGTSPPAWEKQQAWEARDERRPWLPGACGCQSKTKSETNFVECRRQEQRCDCNRAHSPSCTTSASTYCRRLSCKCGAGGLKLRLRRRWMSTPKV